MIKLKNVIVPVIALGIAFTGVAYKIASVKALEGKIAPGPSYTAANIPKSEIHKGTEEVKANTPYKIKYPTVKMDDLKLVDENSDKHTFKDKDIHVVYSHYKGDGNKQLMIQQVDTTEKNPLTESSGVEQIKLSDGTNAWVYDPSNGVGYIHIIFIKDNQSFDVMGSGLGKDRLINIASSLN